MMAEFPLYKQQGWSAPQTFNYLYIGLGFLVLEQGFEIYLSLRQRRYLQKTELPENLVEQVQMIDDAKTAVKAPAVQQMSKEGAQEEEEATTLLGQLKQKFLKSQFYNLDKNTFSFFKMGYSVVLSTALLLSGFQAFLWTKSQEFSQDFLGYDASSEIATGSVFLVASSIIGVITGLPISLYNTFVLENKHGFNKTTPGLFVSDLIKSFLIENILMVPLMAGVVKLVRWGGEQFWFYVWMLMFGFSLLMLTIYPNFIMPLFNKYERLPDGELRDSIEALAKRVEFPLTKLFEVDGSKRSSHSNAYLYGFFRDKRIVLYDTLIRNPDEPALECTTDEIVSIIAHELGHYKLSHTLKGFILQNVVYLVAFKGFGYFLHDPDMYSSFGFSEKPVIIGLNLFGYIMSPISSVLGLLVNSLTRMFEFQADAFAVKLGKVEGLKSGLTKISISNLASFDVDPLYHMFHHSHPSLVERLKTMELEASKIDKKSK